MTRRNFAEPCRRMLKIAVLLAVLVWCGRGRLAYGGTIGTFDHSYAFGGDLTAVQIHVDVDVAGGNYLWTYTVTNNSYSPTAGTNGFSGFELMLPLAVPDIGDVTAPNASWEIDCCSGLPVEWDIRDSVGPGIMPGEVGVFSFTTLPRLITQSTGWFHTWHAGVQTDITPYPAGDGLEVPDVLAPPVGGVPEPGTWSLLGLGALALVGLRRRN